MDVDVWKLFLNVCDILQYVFVTPRQENPTWTEVYLTYKPKPQQKSKFELLKLLNKFHNMHIKWNNYL